MSKSTPKPYPNPHFEIVDVRDRIAWRITRLLRFFADLFFAKGYGHRAIVLETVAAVPGMVGGLLQHLSCLRHIRDDQGFIKELLDEAENERMHLMTFIQVTEPTFFERMMVMIAQMIFYNVYFWVYLFSPKTAHRVVGYFEEEAVVSYTSYLEEIDSGKQENIPAPQIAIDYWNMPKTAKLRDVVLQVRDDEAGHRDRNHLFADDLTRGRQPTGNH